MSETVVQIAVKIDSKKKNWQQQESENEKRIWFSRYLIPCRSFFCCSFLLKWPKHSGKGKKRLLFDTREGSHPHIWDLGDFDSKVWVRALSCRDEQTML